MIRPGGVLGSAARAPSPGGGSPARAPVRPGWARAPTRHEGTPWSSGVRGEGVSLTARAVQGEHQLPRTPREKGSRRPAPPTPRTNSGPGPSANIGVDALHQPDSRNSSRRRILAGPNRAGRDRQAGPRHSPGLGQGSHRPGRISRRQRTTTPPSSRSKDADVESIGSRPQDIAGRLGGEHAGLPPPAPSSRTRRKRENRTCTHSPALRSFGRPNTLVDQLIARHDDICVDEQQRQQRPLRSPPRRSAARPDVPPGGPAPQTRSRRPHPSPSAHPGLSRPPLRRVDRNSKAPSIRSRPAVAPVIRRRATGTPTRPTLPAHEPDQARRRLRSAGSVAESITSNTVICRSRSAATDAASSYSSRSALR